MVDDCDIFDLSLVWLCDFCGQSGFWLRFPGDLWPRGRASELCRLPLYLRDVARAVEMGLDFYDVGQSTGLARRTVNRIANEVKWGIREQGKTTAGGPNYSPLVESSS